MRTVFTANIIALAILTAFSNVSCAQPSNAYKESFDTVWETINSRFYDPGFNGVDWQQSRERFRDEVGSAPDSDSFYRSINTMLFELGVSHLGVVPTDDITQLGEAAAFAEGTVGLDARFIEGRLLVTGVQGGSPAEKAGIRTGFEIVRVNGKTIDEMAEQRKAFPTPPFHDRNQAYNLLGEIYWELMGILDEQVAIELLDHSGELQKFQLERIPRSERAVFQEGMPPTYISFESRRIDENIGYIRFSSFHPNLLDPVVGAIREFAGTRGLVIDLRGNPGGAFPVRRELARHFVEDRSLIWQFRGRGGIDDIYIDPVEEPYRGKLVILTDGFSASSSEEFSGGLQSLDRAVVVGNRTPGRDVVMDITVLPADAYFVFPVAETRTSSGRVLEYNGVQPDFEVSHTPALLAEDRDAQLEKAVELIKATPMSPRTKAI